MRTQHFDAKEKFVSTLKLEIYSSSPTNFPSKRYPLVPINSEWPRFKDRSSWSPDEATFTK